MHTTRKRPSRPSAHPASAMPPPTKPIPAVRSDATPADPHRQERNFTSVQADLPDPRKAPPPSRPSGPQLRGLILARLLVDAVHLDRQPSVIEIRQEQLVGRPTERRLLLQPDRILRQGKRFRSQPESLPPWRRGCARILLTTAAWSITATRRRLPRHGHCKTSALNASLIATDQASRPEVCRDCSTA